jgi:hypothetical protein
MPFTAPSYCLRLGLLPVRPTEQTLTFYLWRIPLTDANWQRFAERLKSVPQALSHIIFIIGIAGLLVSEPEETCSAVFLRAGGVPSQIDPEIVTVCNPCVFGALEIPKIFEH